MNSTPWQDTNCKLAPAGEILNSNLLAPHPQIPYLKQTNPHLMKPANAIQERVLEFLQQYPPFNLISQEQLQQLAGQVRVQYLEPEQTLFNQGDTPHEVFYVVRQGSVRLEQGMGEAKRLVDVCDEGDVFGARALIAKKNYSSTATATEETLVYGVSIALFDPILHHNPEVALYFAAGFAAGGPVQQGNMQETNEARRSLHRTTTQQLHLEDVLTLSTGHNKVTCTAQTSIRLAAQIMSDKDSSFILVVDEEEHPIGILTDTDLRKRVVAGHVGIDDMVEAVMSEPEVTIAPNPHMAEALLLLMRHRVKHLCVTRDGTVNSPVEGVLTEHHLLLAQGNNPVVLVQEIRQTSSIAHLPAIRNRAEELLQKYLEQDVNIAFVANIMTEINDALVVRALQHAEGILGEPPLRYCWLSIGSEGREEQLLRTDQDNALVFEDAHVGLEQEAQAYFVQLAVLVNEVLEQCGFEKCPANMMAGNPKWCQPLHAWKQYFHNWIHEPTEEALLNASIFFDYRPLHGNLVLAKELTSYIYEHIQQERIFLPYLAKHALQSPPPLSFFRNFMVERGGDHKDQFDIKLRAMTPLVDAARVLTLYNRVAGENNTFKRFARLAELEPQNATLYREAAMAYEIMMRHRALSGLRNNDTGRYINPAQLNKLERQTLRNTFKIISDVQELLQVRFQLNYLNA
ncbi:CBS domain-containing protein [Pontibacter akesuensis]|uniref:CBS domain-containing protein n=2 Tax=Pontibacter akesuensis TaxID=388950 RepID=A0A1I7J8U1_9BACT|nr:CBS domain-containing protein [Pontibacter akesuensis]